MTVVAPVGDDVRRLSLIPSPGRVQGSSLSHLAPYGQFNALRHFRLPLIDQLRLHELVLVGNVEPSGVLVVERIACKAWNEFKNLTPASLTSVNSANTVFARQGFRCVRIN